jgi:hypothetical protein
MRPRPQGKISVIGGGIIGLMEVYFELLASEEKPFRATVYEKNQSTAYTTTAHLVPSLTPDEILAVVPRGQELTKKLALSFTQTGGMRVDDVPAIYQSRHAFEFIQQAQNISLDEKSHLRRVKVLLEMGKAGMDLWKYIYDSADDKLKKIMQESNFNPCYENKIHGYRVDLLCHVKNAEDKAKKMMREYQGLGYHESRIITPQELIERDSFFTDFCLEHSRKDKNNHLIWNNDATALLRPGGCINTQIFLPKFIGYLRDKMGQYKNALGKTKDCFRIKFERHVNKVILNDNKIAGLGFFNHHTLKKNKYSYLSSHYIFCPGENIGELDRLGFLEPASARFAGASLLLTIPVPKVRENEFRQLNQFMEIHQEALGFAWQAWFKNNKIFIGIAGTKAFYGNEKPNIHQAFAKNRNLLQLNTINEILPECLSLALGRNTKNQKLTENDLNYLEVSQMAERHVGSRAVSFDGFPTLGAVYDKQHHKIHNARTTTHLSSGGVSFSLIAVQSSRKTEKVSDRLMAEISELSRSDRTALPRSRL